MITIYPGYATQISTNRFADKILVVLNLDTICKVITKSACRHLSRLLSVEIESYSIETVAVGMGGPIVCNPYKYDSIISVRSRLWLNLDLRLCLSSQLPDRLFGGFDPKVTVRSKFERRNRQTGQKEMITYLDYYTKELKLKINFPDQTLIRTRGRSGTTIYLVPDLNVATNIPAVQSSASRKWHRST